MPEVPAKPRPSAGPVRRKAPVSRASGKPRDRRACQERAKSEPDYTSEEVAFSTAMDRYKRTTGRKFPTWSEALSVLKSLGYAKVTLAEGGGG